MLKDIGFVKIGVKEDSKHRKKKCYQISLSQTTINVDELSKKIEIPIIKELINYISFPLFIRPQRVCYSNYLLPFVVAIAKHRTIPYDRIPYPPAITTRSDGYQIPDLKKLGMFDLIIVGDPKDNPVIEPVINDLELDIKFMYSRHTDPVLHVYGDKYDGRSHGVVILMPNIYSENRERVIVIITAHPRDVVLAMMYSIAIGTFSKKIDELSECNALVMKMIRPPDSIFYGDANIVKDYFI